MIKPGRYDRDIRQPAAEGWSFADKSFISQELDEAHPKVVNATSGWSFDLINYLIATGVAPEKATVNSFNDPRRVKITSLDGLKCWDGTPHAASDYLIEGMYKAEHSQQSKSDSTVSSVINNSHNDGIVTLDRTYPGINHNVSFFIRSKLATSIQLQYSVMTAFTYWGTWWQDDYGEYPPNPPYIPPYNVMRPAWTNCGTATSVAAGGQVFISSGEIVVGGSIPPIVEFRLLVSDSEDHHFEVYQDSKYHETGFIATKIPVSYIPLLPTYSYSYSLAQQNYYSSVIPDGWTETNMPIHLATRMRVAGAPEHFTEHIDGRIRSAIYYGNPLSYEGNQASVVDPVNYYESEINQPKEVFNSTLRKFHVLPDRRPEDISPYTRLYLKDIGFRNYTGITSPGQHLIMPLSSVVYRSRNKPEVSLLHQHFCATAERVAVWARLDANLVGGEFFLDVYSVDDMADLPDLTPMMREDHPFYNPNQVPLHVRIQEKCTTIGSSSISVNSGFNKHIYQTESTDHKLYLVVLRGTCEVPDEEPAQNPAISTTIVVTTPATPPLFDVLNIKGAVDPSKLFVENGLRWTNSHTLVNYTVPGPDFHNGSSTSTFHKPEIVYTSQPVEATFPFTVMGTGEGFTSTTMCFCFSNPQLPGVSGDNYFYANCTVEAVGGEDPKVINGHGCCTWDGGTVSRDEVGGWRTRTNSEIGNSAGLYFTVFYAGLQRPWVGRSGGRLAPSQIPNEIAPGNIFDTYTKNGVPIYVYVTVYTRYDRDPPTSIKITLVSVPTTVVPIAADGSEITSFSCTSFTAPTSGTYEVEAWGEKNTFITSKNLNNLNDGVMRLKTDTCGYLPNGVGLNGDTYNFAIIKNQADWDSYMPDDQTVYDFLVLDSFEDDLPESIYKNKHIRYDPISQRFIEIRMPGIINEKTCVNIDTYDNQLSRYVRKSYSYDPITKKIGLSSKKDSIRLNPGETVYTRVVDYGYVYDDRNKVRNSRKITFTPDEP